MSKQRLWALWSFSVVCVVLDSMTKGWIYGYFHPPATSFSVFPYGGYGVFQNILGIDCCIQKVINLGGAWGIFSQFSTWLVYCRIALVMVLFVKIIRGSKTGTGYSSLVFITWGALANIIDYFRFGGVVDWIHLTFWSYSFPVFNIADMMISLGVVFWMSQIMWQKGDKGKKNVAA